MALRLNKNSALPRKRTMNLYFKPDRTTKPATVALYVLFAATVALGISKVAVYDLWEETREAEQSLRSAERRLEEASAGLGEYSEVKLKYVRYAATDEELALVDRLEILDLLEDTVGAAAKMGSISISGSRVSCPFEGVTLAQVAGIVQELEASELVEGVTVSTAFSARDGKPADGNDPVTADMTVQLIVREAPEKASGNGAGLEGTR